MVDSPPPGEGLRRSAPDGPDTAVVTQAAQLRALAHPLRLRLLGLLRTGGPSTASRLAVATGESSGLTSYHLRQLEGAGFVADVDATAVPAGSVRERWWRAVHRYTRTSFPPPDDVETTAATEDYERVVVGAYADRSLAWLAARRDWPLAYTRATSASDAVLRLTAAEMADLRDDLFAVVERYRQHDPSPDAAPAPEDAVVVSLQLQLFPDPRQAPPAPGRQDAEAPGPPPRDPQAEP